MYKKQLKIIMGTASLIGFTGTAQAVELYAGADLVKLESELSYTGIFAGEPKQKFTTDHFRLKGGIEATRWLAVEAQFLTSADGKDTDSVGDVFSHDTGTIFGVFAKPHMTIGSFDLYALVGYATADAEFDCSPSCPPAWKETLDGVAYGVGAQFLVTKKLKISVDYMSYHDGSATYIDNTTVPIIADQTTSGFGIGVNYTF